MQAELDNLREGVVTSFVTSSFRSAKEIENFRVASRLPTNLHVYSVGQGPPLRLTLG